MKKLVLKDMKLIGFQGYLIYIIGTVILGRSIFLLNNQYIRFWGLSILAIFMSYIIQTFSYIRPNNYDEDIIFNILPIEREKIVASRYITIIIYIFLSAFLIWGSAVISINRGIVYKAIFQSFDIMPPRLLEVFWIIGISILFYSIYLPIDYYLKGKYNERDELSIIIVGILLVLIRISMILENSLYRFINNINYNQIPFILIIISILSYLVSLFISIKIYENREF